MKSLKWLAAPMAALLIGGTTACNSDNQSQADSLYADFLNPPADARPRVWWHWMDGNVTKDGIAKDLAWMQRSGIAGFMNFYAGMATPQIVDQRLTFLSDGWKDAFNYATQLADSMGMEMSIACSPGWSFTGGPWVKPEDGMKKLVWREVRAKGGTTFNAALPEPYKTIGTFQNIPRSGNNSFNASKDVVNEGYYADIAVLAYRLPDSDIDLKDLNPTISSSGGRFTLEALTDGDLSKSAALPPVKNGKAWIQYTFNEPVTVKAISWVDGQVRGQWAAPKQELTRTLEVSQDGKTFSKVCDLPNSSAEQGTVSFAATTGRCFRVLFNNRIASNPYAALMGGDISPEPVPIQVAELVLHPVTRVNHAEEKAGFAAPADLALFDTPAESDVVKTSDVVDLTALVKNGRLTWNVPEGNWKIVRYGYSQTGKQNSPAPPDATGFEIDKMDAEAVKNYFDYYIGMYKDIVGDEWGSTIQYLMADSYESEQENWTPRMFAEFEKHCGYSLLPWMPALQGQIVNSSAETERFLRDWRRTLGQLVVENLYDQMTDILDTYHMGRYTESHENGRVYLTDGMDVKRRSSVPMAAAWMPNETGASTPAMSQADIRESASVAHIYGQNIVAGESLTAPGGPGKSYAYHPANMKFIADMEMYSGLNRFVIHTSVHQPVDDKIPGLGLGPIGQWFNRHENWAESAWAWMDYLGRSSYMLQQGHYVADVVYYYGEDNCITGLYGEQLPDVPAGYSYDFINSDALLNLLQAQDGRLTTPSGMSYRVLALGDNARTLPLPVLRKIAQLAQQGVTICGVKPERCGSLTDDEQEFYDLVQQIWGGGMHNVLVGASVAQALQQQGIAPDVELKDGLRFVHRNSKDTDIYWVNNPQGEARTVELSFRTSGKKPEVWHPEDGRREEVSYSIKDGRTTVTLNLAEDDAVFVVFSGKAKQQEMKLPALQSQTLLTLNNDWNVRFQEHRGAPESMTMEQLADLSQTTEPGVKYFSGVASYSKRFSLDQEQLNGQQLFIDLGQVGVMAEVTLNGQPVGLVWKTPFRVDATKAAKAGENLLEVKVTNLWINRLIGDSTLPEAERISWTPYPFYNASVPLSPSGLMGPVQVVAVK